MYITNQRALLSSPLVIYFLSYDPILTAECLRLISGEHHHLARGLGLRVGPWFEDLGYMPCYT